MVILILRKLGRRISRVLPALALCIPLFPNLEQPLSAQASAIPEYRVKATFLFQFTQFVDWPVAVAFQMEINAWNIHSRKQSTS